MVYVDELREYPTDLIKAGARQYGNQWCHLTTDGDREELHIFASQLGLRRSWFQDHPRLFHYDLTPSKRARAVELGAQEVKAREHLLWLLSRSKS